jgi:hypothetical protein
MFIVSIEKESLLKTILILLSCVIIHSACTSQSIRSYGIKTGYVSATQTWETTAPYSYQFPIEDRSGMDIGIFVEWLNMPILSILTEAHYIQKGNREGSGTWLGPQQCADYLSVPILAKARLSSPPFNEMACIPYVIAGPRIEFLLSTKAEGFERIYDNLRKIDYGATLGAGIEFSSIGPFRIDLEFQYSPNFRDAYSDPYTKVRNNSWEVLLGVGM